MEIANTLISLVTGGTLFNLYIQWKSRKFQTDKIGYEALSSLQILYDKATAQMSGEFEELRRKVEDQKIEIDTLKFKLSEQMQKCQNCNNG